MSTNLMNQSWSAIIPRLLAVALVAAVIVAIMRVAVRRPPTGPPSAPRSPQPQTRQPTRLVDSPLVGAAAILMALVAVLLVEATGGRLWWLLVILAGAFLAIKFLPSLAIGTLGCLLVGGGMTLMLVVVSCLLLFVRIEPKSTTLVYHDPSGTSHVVMANIETSTTPAMTKAVEKASPGAKPSDEKKESAAKEAPKVETEDKGARPKWVDAPDAYVGTVYEMTVMSGPFTDDLQCVEAMPREIQTRIEKYVAEVYRGGQGPGAVSISIESLLAELPQLITAKYQETRDTSVGPMRVHYAQLSFGEGVNRWIEGNLRDLAIRRRIEYLGTGITGVLAALGVAWVCLKRAAGRMATRTQTANKT